MVLALGLLLLLLLLMSILRELLMSILRELASLIPGRIILGVRRKMSRFWDRIAMLRDGLRSAPAVAGALFGLALVGFGILAVVFFRDLIVATRECAGRQVQILLCQIRAEEAQARLPWEVVGLLIIGAAIGAARVLRR